MDPQPKQPPLVGVSRIRLVDGLLALVDQVQELGEARWVSLEAPSGWGKTRVAQELYARLAARQTELETGHYWPATILEAIDAPLEDTVGFRRKRVFPERIDRAAGSLPAFFWWGIACDMRSCGTASQNLLEDLLQLDAHALYLDAAWTALTSFRERHFPTLAQARQDLGRIIAEGLEEGAGHLIGVVIEALAKHGLPGGGLVVKLGRWGIGKAAETQRRCEKVAAAGPLGSDKPPDLLDDTVTMLTRLARPGLPVIVFVEDLHVAWRGRRAEDGPSLIEELLERLVRSNASLLILTTVWPGELDQRERLMAVTAEPMIRPRFLRVRHDQPTPPALPPDASLDVLPDAALRELILFYYSQTDPETLARLAARWTNPLPLELVCTLPKYRQRFQDGALKLPAAEIEALPQRVEDLYRDLWNALPEPVQQALALSTLAIPDQDATWYHRLTRQAIEQCLELRDHEALARTLGEDRIPHGWVRAIEEWRRRFNEPDQLRIAHKAVGDFYFDEDIDHYLDRLGAAIRADGLEGTGPQTQHCARLMLTLHRNRKGGVNDSDALQAIRVLQEALNDLPRELPMRIALGEYLRRLAVNADSAEMLSGRANYALALGESGQVQAAAAVFAALLGDAMRVRGPEHSYTLSTRGNIAHCRAEAGEIKSALADYAALLADETRLLGPDQPVVLTTRNNIAYWHAQAGQLAPALTVSEALLGDQTRILGPDDPSTLTTRNNITYWRAQAGHIPPAVAVTAFEELLGDQTRILGPDHRDTLRTRGNIAHWLADAGQFESALLAFDALLSDEIGILGPDHPNTLMTRNDIAHCRSRTGQVEHALTALEALLSDQFRILGPDHSDTLLTRGGIAYCRGEAGQIEPALAAFEALLSDRARILGTDHLDTLKTRSNIAYLRAEAGHIQPALAAFEAVFGDFERLFGADHPEALTTRHHIAYWRAKAGQIKSALTDFEALLSDQMRILDPNHPHIQESREWIKHLSRRLGTNRRDPPGCRHGPSSRKCPP